MQPFKKSANITFPDDGGAYTSFSYPAGERQVRLTEAAVEMVKGADEVRVLARVHSPQDVLDLILLGDAIGGLTPQSLDIKLYLPYFPYARADRRFVEGDCYGLGAFANLLAVGSFSPIITMDLHSDALSSVIHNVPPYPLMEKAIQRFAGLNEQNSITVLFPDKGACLRYGGNIMNNIGNNHSQITVFQNSCEKVRDPHTGKLSGFKVPHIYTPTAIILDDICDGGGTFLGIAAEIHRTQPGIKLGLYVTHGIFSQGFEALKQRFQAIYTTNTFRDMIEYGYEDVVVFDAIPYLLKETSYANSTSQHHQGRS